MLFGAHREKQLAKKKINKSAIVVAGTTSLFNCSTWYLVMASRPRQATMSVKTGSTFPFIGDITRGKS